MPGKLAWLVVTCAATAANLPVYIEDSHAGTFYWAIENLALNRDVQLVLIDAHSESIEVFDSDAVRQRVLQAASTGNSTTWSANGERAASSNASIGSSL